MNAHTHIYDTHLHTQTQSDQQGAPSNNARLEPFPDCPKKKLESLSAASNYGHQPVTRPERQRRGGIQKKRLAFELAGGRQ